MAKRFKLKFTVPSFQMCRSKSLSTFPGNPIPAIYRLSPVNPKARDIGIPNLLSPPPSTPEPQTRSSRACKQHVPFNCCTSSSPDIIHCDSTFCKTGGDHNNKDKKVKARGRKSTSSVPSRRSDFLIDNFNEEESETLISSLTSFSDEFCHDEMVHSPGAPNHNPEKELISGHRRKISSVNKVQRLRFHASENRRQSDTGQMKKTTVMSRASMRRCTMEGEGKAKESFAVVKKSKDPYEDFKKSMLEMIMEMEMFAAEDLEQLLQCFLALNSRSYHGVIVRAFMEIWQLLFCVNPASTKNLLTHVKSQNDLEK